MAEYDAVILVGGLIDAAYLHTESYWIDHVHRLLAAVRSRISDAVPVVVMGIPRLSCYAVYGVARSGVVDSWTTRLNTATQALCAGVPSTYYQPTADIPFIEADRYRTPDDYRRIAEHPATILAPLLNNAADNLHRGSRRREDTPQAIQRRAAAIRALPLTDGAGHARFDTIVRHARDVFAVDGAAFTLVDHDRQWNVSSSGIDVTQIPQAESFCATTILLNAPFVVEDAHTGPDQPEGAIRFYAGCPIEAPDGTRIGALCVFDKKPHTVDDHDLELLHHLAFTIQQQLTPHPAL